MWISIISVSGSKETVCAFREEHSAFLGQQAPSFRGIGPSTTPYLPAPSAGVFAHNDALHKAQILFKGQVLGSESVAVSEDGVLYMLDKFGVVFRSKDKRSLERLAFLGPGRPLGFHFDKAGNLLICNAGSGLQMLEKGSGKVALLVTEAPDARGNMTPIREIGREGC